MGRSFNIRHGEVKDAAQLIELLPQLDIETTFTNREPGEFCFSLAEEEDFLKSSINSPIQCFLVAEIDNKIIGVLGLTGNSLKKFRHTCTLGMGVLKEYWGMGIGSALIDASVNWAKANSITRIQLQVVETNIRAMALYERKGFKKEGILQDGIKINDCFWNIVQMGLLLTNIID